MPTTMWCHGLTLLNMLGLSSSHRTRSPPCVTIGWTRSRPVHIATLSHVVALTFLIGTVPPTFVHRPARLPLLPVTARCSPCPTISCPNRRRRHPPLVRPGRRRRRPRPALAIRRDVLARRARSDRHLVDAAPRRRPRPRPRRLPDRPGMHGTGDGSRVQHRPGLTVQQGAPALCHVRSRPPHPRRSRRAAAGATDRATAPATDARRRAGRPSRVGDHRRSRSTPSPAPTGWPPRCSTSATIRR